MINMKWKHNEWDDLIMLACTNCNNLTSTAQSSCWHLKERCSLFFPCTLILLTLWTHSISRVTTLTSLRASITRVTVYTFCHGLITVCASWTDDWVKIFLRTIVSRWTWYAGILTTQTVVAIWTVFWWCLGVVTVLSTWAGCTYL